jgi:hypothetical protein
VRAPLTWASTLPLVPIGVLAGHAVGYELAGSGAHEAHGYLDYAPLFLAVCTALVLAGFVARIARVERGLPSRPAPAWIFAALPPLAFLLQEYLERLFQDGHVGWATAFQPAVLLGLYAQVPFALLAFLVARALGSLADVVGRALGSEVSGSVGAAPLLVPGSAVLLPVSCIAGRGYGERGPPLAR